MLQVVVDHQMSYEELLQECQNNPVGTCVIKKYYHRSTTSKYSMVTADDLASILAGIIGPDTILMERSVSGIDQSVLRRALQSTSKQHLMPKETSMHYYRTWQNLVPGFVPCQLGRIFNIAFPKERLMYNTHRAGPDALMTQMVMRLLVRAHEGKFRGRISRLKDKHLITSWLTR